MHSQPLTPGTDELAEALALHEAISRLCAERNLEGAGQALTALSPLLQRTAWPQRDKVEEAIREVQEGSLSVADFFSSNWSDEWRCRG